MSLSLPDYDDGEISNVYQKSLLRLRRSALILQEILARTDMTNFTFLRPAMNRLLSDLKEVEQTVLVYSRRDDAEKFEFFARATAVFHAGRLKALVDNIGERKVRRLFTGEEWSLYCLVMECQSCGHGIEANPDPPGVMNVLHRMFGWLFK